jgi:hypothetical protein
MKELDPFVFLAVFEEMLGWLFWPLAAFIVLGAVVFVMVIVRDRGIYTRPFVLAEVAGALGGLAAVWLMLAVTNSSLADMGGPIDWLLVVAIFLAGAIGTTVVGDKAFGAAVAAAGAGLLVVDAGHAARMFRQTGCRAVMVGRAALIRPWIFRDILSYLKNGVIPEPPAPIEVVDRFLDMLERFSEAEWRLRRLRLFCFWFLQNFAYGLHYFKTVCREPTPAAMHQLLHALLAEERIPPYPCRPFLQG